MAITCPGGTAGRQGGHAGARSPRTGPRSEILPPLAATRAPPVLPGNSRPAECPAGRRQQHADRAIQARAEVPEGEHWPAARARAANRGQVTPADQAAARVGEGRACAAARALGIQDRADALPAVAQAPLVADVLAGCRYLEEQGRTVLGRAGQGPRVGEGMQAVEPAAAPAARRGMATVPHAARVANGPVDAGGAEREPREGGSGTVSRQHGVCQLVTGEWPVRALALGGPRRPQRQAAHPRECPQARSADRQ